MTVIETTAPVFPTQEWLDLFAQHLRDSKSFCSATSSWNDDAMFVIDADDAVGWEKPVAFYMNWKGGRIVQADVVADVDRPAVFRVRGAYSAWAHVYHSKMEASVAFLTGKFQFRGPFAKAARNMVGQTLMLKTAFTVPSQFLPPKGANR